MHSSQNDFTFTFTISKYRTFWWVLCLYIVIGMSTWRLYRLTLNSFATVRTASLFSNFYIRINICIIGQTALKVTQGRRLILVGENFFKKSRCLDRFFFFKSGSWSRSYCKGHSDSSLIINASDIIISSSKVFTFNENNRLLWAYSFLH